MYPSSGYPDEGLEEFSDGCIDQHTGHSRDRHLPPLPGRHSGGLVQAVADDGTDEAESDGDHGDVAGTDPLRPAGGVDGVGEDEEHAYEVGQGDDDDQGCLGAVAHREPQDVLKGTSGSP